MAKKTKTARATKTEEAITMLQALVDGVSPGNVTLCHSGRTGDPDFTYELTLDTRACKYTWTGATIAGVVAEARDEPGEDLGRIRPAWRRLTRMQRKVVRRKLQELGARHTGGAATAEIAGTREAAAAYELADAFFAAFDELDFYEEMVTAP